jgi:type II secretory pathway component PulF
MKPTIFLLSLLLILSCMVIPAHAVVYSEEYQKTMLEQQQLLGTTSNFYKVWDAYGGCASGKAANIIYLELRRQTILMEKQNELLEEQNGLLRNLTNRTP